jgi:mRNA-degrading endonuclease toxin of MazEF toxin-antitoxin module
VKGEAGDLVTVAAKGAYTGKPRVALIIQSELFDALDSVTLYACHCERSEAI